MVEEPYLIVVFGSLPNANYTQYSDIDVLCVFDRDFNSYQERFIIAYRHSDGIVQPKSLTLNEFRQGLLEGNNFLHHIISNGFTVFSKIKEAQINSWISKGRKYRTIRNL